MKEAQSNNTADAAVFARTGGPEALEIARQPRPVPGPGEVLIRNEAAGVNNIDTLVSPWRNSG